jgi:hypothetical protein
LWWFGCDVGGGCGGGGGGGEQNYLNSAFKLINFNKTLDGI